jgi:hypothetical protein
VKQYPIKSGLLFEINQRRGNLFSLVDWREVFNSCVYETTRLRTQSKEIAEEPLAGGGISLSLCPLNHNGMIRPANGFPSRMWQYQTLLIMNTLHTEARNDEGKCKGRNLRPLHKNLNT